MMIAEMPKMKKRATIEEADNGYIVRCYDEKGNEKMMVAKSMDEAMAEAKKMMGAKMEKSNKKMEREYDEETRANHK